MCNLAQYFKHNNKKKNIAYSPKCAMKLEEKPTICAVTEVEARWRLPGCTSIPAKLGTSRGYFQVPSQQVGMTGAFRKKLLV